MADPRSMDCPTGSRLARKSRDCRILCASILTGYGGRRPILDNVPFYLYVGFAAALGFYITVHGFSAAATKRPPQSNHPTELLLLRSIRAHSDRQRGR